ncbi:hypothetical protein H5410_051597 [Solanum commersonii]|uniref:Retrovirus-related Pol polyprotein from transposon TNT 1-94-like beta-barrel domain-containing protein n=1 Tax=Solanum commersonii TaxID=4109 RepID=A0A9J5WYX2_SOLCO|nr:hypothetical protein H5410_051597 [Solanum commersonii]
MKRRKEEPLEQLLKTQASFKGFEVEALEEEEVTPTNLTMKIKVTSHSEVVVVVNKEVKGVEPTKCYNCHKIGHYSWEYRSNVEELVNRVDNNKHEDESTLLLTLKEEDTANYSSWYLDNGANNHMCGHKDKFLEIKMTVKGNVSFGDPS